MDWLICRLFYIDIPRGVRRNVTAVLAGQVEGVRAFSHRDLILGEAQFDAQTILFGNPLLMLMLPGHLRDSLNAPAYSDGVLVLALLLIRLGKGFQGG